MIYLTLFLVNTLYIWLKAFQQLNIQYDKYTWIPPISVCMAFCEVFTVGAIAYNPSFILALPIGLGGGLGAILAILTHRKLRK